MSNNQNLIAKDSKEVLDFSWLDLVKAFYFLLDSKKIQYFTYTTILALIFLYDLVPTFLVGKIIDFFTNFKTGDSLSVFYLYTTILAGTWGIVSMIRLSVKKRLSMLRSDVSYFTRVKGFERLLDFSISWHEKENTGNKVQKIQNGTGALKQLQLALSDELLFKSVSIIGVLVSFLIIKPSLFFYSLLYIAIFAIVQLSFYHRMVEMNNQNNILMEKASGTYYEGLNNLLTIKSMGAKDDFKKNILSQEAMTRDHSIKLTLLVNNKWKVFQIINAFSIGGILFFAGQSFVAQVISIGSVLIIYNYFMKLNGAVSQFADSIERLINSKISIARMMPIFWVGSQNKGGSLNFPTDWKTINIENANFSYPLVVGNNPDSVVGLKELNVIINKYEKIGIVGKSGSGKSTFVKTFIGLYEFNSGRFSIGDIDFRDIKHDEITKKITLVLQDSEMFNLSLKDNITLMKEFDPILFDKAISIAQLKDVIKKLPDGIETLIGEKGYKLSGGERQRIGIARAIYKNSQILIFDEATSSLDSETEALIQNAIEANLKDQTVVSIAHRVSTLKNTNRILVFDGGQIVEEGTFKELSDNNDSKFNEVYRKQVSESI